MKRNSDRSALFGTLNVYHFAVSMGAAVGAFMYFESQGHSEAPWSMKLLAAGAAVVSGIIGGVFINCAFATVSETILLLFIEAPARMSSNRPRLVVLLNPKSRT
jgi:hypothetical protein